MESTTTLQHISAPNLRTTHAFFTRHGGVSTGAYASLNLAGTQDDPALIAENRRIALHSLGLDPSTVSYLKQVHGCDVMKASPGQQEGDALVSNERGMVLAVAAADCYPVLFHDPVAGVVGAAHCGWKGTLLRIAVGTIRSMENLGARLSDIQVAIGPGISGAAYEVSPELIASFREAGFGESCFSGRHLDLAACIRQVVAEAGVPENSIWTCGRCTTESDFFSHRRDHGVTGRMWAVISL
jgi:hypothetical protein